MYEMCMALIIRQQSAHSHGKTTTKCAQPR